MSMPADGRKGSRSIADETSADASRRAFLKTVAVLVPAVGVFGSCRTARSSARADAPVYFSESEKSFVDAATGRREPFDFAAARLRSGRTDIGFFEG